MSGMENSVGIIITEAYPGHTSGWINMQSGIDTHAHMHTYANILYLACIVCEKTRKMVLNTFKGIHTKNAYIDDCSASFLSVFLTSVL